MWVTPSSSRMSTKTRCSLTRNINKATFPERVFTAFIFFSCLHVTVVLNNFCFTWLPFFKFVFFLLWGFFLSPTLFSSCRSLRIFSWWLKWWIIHYFIIVYRLQNTKHCEFHFKLYLYLSSEPLLKLFSLITAFTSQLQLKLMIFNWKSYRNMFLNLYIYCFSFNLEEMFPSNQIAPLSPDVRKSDEKETSKVRWYKTLMT